MKLHERFTEAKFINQAKRDFNWSGTPPVGDAEIEEDAAINDAVIDITGGVKIGKRVHFGREVMILSCSHPPSVKNGLERRKSMYCDSIVIEEDAYIGSRAIILPGVKIGKSAYVAAGAVVVKDVESFTLVAGTPGKFIRKIV